jgi:hypothetical protein
VVILESGRAVRDVVMGQVVVYSVKKVLDSVVVEGVDQNLVAQSTVTIALAAALGDP